MLVAFFKMFLPLFFAHILGDFVLQTDTSVREKEQITGLLRHGLIIGILSYLFLGLIGCWQIPLGIAVSHILLDAWKLRSKKGTRLSRFLIDQAGHITILALFAWAAGYSFSAVPLVGVVLFGKGYLILLAFLSGAITSIYVGSFPVELAFEALGIKGPQAEKMDDTSGGNNSLDEGIPQGGRVIGYLERALILLFILADYPAGIGFLVAAKSIFRFGELTDATRRSQAEYIIIGTLLSILIGTAVSYLTAALLQLLLG
ncbi:MAG: DUF3307 domain-containing protein [Anaerolineales bacterium]|jgi:hypothetical protein